MALISCDSLVLEGDPLQDCLASGTFQISKNYETGNLLFKIRVTDSKIRVSPHRGLLSNSLSPLTVRVAFDADHVPKNPRVQVLWVVLNEDDHAPFYHNNDDKLTLEELWITLDKSRIQSKILRCTIDKGFDAGFYPNDELCNSTMFEEHDRKSSKKKREEKIVRDKEEEYTKIDKKMIINNDENDEVLAKILDRKYELEQENETLKTQLTEQTKKTILTEKLLLDSNHDLMQKIQEVQKLDDKLRSSCGFIRMIDGFFSVCFKFLRSDCVKFITFLFVGFFLAEIYRRYNGEKVD